MLGVFQNGFFPPFSYQMVAETFLCFSVWEPCKAVRGKTQQYSGNSQNCVNTIHKSMVFLPECNFQTCPQWASSNSLIIAQVFLPQHWVSSPGPGPALELCLGFRSSSVLGTREIKKDGRGLTSCRVPFPYFLLAFIGPLAGGLGNGWSRGEGTEGQGSWRLPGWCGASCSTEGNLIGHQAPAWGTSQQDPSFQDSHPPTTTPLPATPIW